MSFSKELTKIMQIRNITAQDISEKTGRKISVVDVRRFQKDGGCPTTYQTMLLNNIFGIDFELIISPSVPGKRRPLQPERLKSDFKKVTSINKPGVKVKSSKIKNSITRLHNIPKPDQDKMICGHCYQLSETCRYNHPEDSEIKLIFGGPGYGEKSPDEMVALICDKCTPILDKKPIKNASRLVKLEHAILWGKAIIFSQAMRIAELENKRKT